MLVSQILILAILGVGGYEYIRLRRRATILYRLVRNTMDCDELLDQLLEEQTPAVVPDGPCHKSQGGCPAGQAEIRGDYKRERLGALAAGGQAKPYLGRNVTVEQIDGMVDDEVEKLYTRYEARLGAAMTKTLGAAALQLYSTVVGKFLPIPPENRPKLVADLEADPFVEHALSSATCELYHKYGMYLAPLTTALTTAKYCQFGGITSQDIQPILTEDVGFERGTTGSGGESDSPPAEGP